MKLEEIPGDVTISLIHRIRFAFRLRLNLTIFLFNFSQNEETTETGCAEHHWMCI